MNTKEVQALMGDFTELSKNNFRTVFLSNLNHSDIESVVFYFDNDKEKPLYEIIINYKSEVLRDTDTQKLLGAPNHKEKEWKLKSGKDYPIHAWTFQKKLVLVAVLPGTEWDGEDL